MKLDCQTSAEVAESKEHFSCDIHNPEQRDWRLLLEGPLPAAGAQFSWPLQLQSSVSLSTPPPAPAPLLSSLALFSLVPPVSLALRSPASLPSSLAEH